MCYSSRRVDAIVCSSLNSSLGELFSYTSRFFEWKKNVVKTPYFIYQTEPLINEKHYPDVNVDKILQTIENDKLPLLAMAGLFDVNRHCEVVSEYEELFRSYSFSFNRPIPYIHARFAPWMPAKRCKMYIFECR